MLATKNRRVLLLWVVVLTQFCCLASGAVSPARGELQLTAAERAWLESHPGIRVGIMNAWPPLNYLDERGEPQGIGVEYLHAINEQLGNALTIVPGPFKENYDRVQEKTLDALMDITPKEDREPFFNFTRPYIAIPHAIVARTDGPYFRNELDLAGKTVALERGFYNIKYFQENYPEVRVQEYNATNDCLDAVARGEADAYAGNRAVAVYLIEKELMTNLKLHGKLSKPASHLAIGVRKDWPELAAILERALAALPKERVNRIVRKWVAPEAGGMAVAELALNEREKDFLARHKPLRFSEVPWEPLAVIDSSGKFTGMIADYMQFVSDKSGLRFEFEQSETWAEVLEKYAQGGIDMVPALSKDDHLGREILLSKPYVSFPMVIVTRNTVSYIGATSELNGKTVAVGKGYTSSQFLKKNYPGIILKETDDVRQGLLKVANGEAFAFVDHVAVAAEALQRLGMRNLKISGETEFRFDHRIGVDPRFPEAVAIIDKSLGLMSEEEGRTIFRKWLHVEYARGIDYELIWNIIGIASVFILLFVFWNRRLAKEVTARKKAEERFTGIAARVPGVIFQAEFFPNGTWVYAFLSQRADEFFSVPAQAVIEDKRSLAWHPEDRERIDGECRRAYLERSEIMMTGRIVLGDGTLKWVHVMASQSDAAEGRRVCNGLIQDITQLKLAELEYRKSEGKATAMSRAVKDALIMLDGRGKVRFWNLAAERLFGFTADEAEGMDFHEMAVPEEATRQKAQAGLHGFAATGKGAVFGATLETVAQNRNKATFPVAVTLSSFQADGEWFSVGTVRDITERKKMEEAAAALLVESQQRNAELEMINRLVAEMTEALDVEKIVDVTVRAIDEHFSPYAISIARYHPESNQIVFIYYRIGDKLHQQPPLAMGHGLTSAVLLGKSSLLLGTLTEQLERGAGIVNGECQTYLGVPILSGGSAIGVLSIQDTQPNRYTEDQARLASTIAANLGIALENARLYQKTVAAEERNRLILDSVGDGIFGVDTAGCVTFINPAALRMLGFTPDEMIGKEVHGLIHNRHADGAPYPKEACAMANSYELGQPCTSIDEVLWRKDGSGFSAECASTPIEKDGRITGAVVAFRDVTERRKAEEKLMHYLEELEQFNRLAVDREERMIELKIEINGLMQQLGMQEKYTVVQ